MGSTSLQVSFIPADKNFKGDNMTVSIDGKKYTVYAHSYLCYGRGAFERRYLAKLVVVSSVADFYQLYLGLGMITRQVSFELYSDESKN